MKWSSTFILGSLMALSLAACRSSREGGMAGERTGAADSTAMTRDTGSSMDTAMSGGAGMTRDTGRAHKDTTAR